MEEEKNKRILRILSAIHKLVNLRTDLLKPGVPTTSLAIFKLFYVYIKSVASSIFITYNSKLFVYIGNQMKNNFLYSLFVICILYRILYFTYSYTD